MYATVRGSFNVPAGVVALFGLLLGQGSGWMYIVALNTNVTNFPPQDRGKIVGMLVCCFGLCSGVFSKLRKAFFPPGSCGDTSISSFLLFLGLCTSGIAVGGTFCVNTLLTSSCKSELWLMILGYAFATIAAMFICASSFAEQFAHVDPQISAILLMGILGSLLFLAFLGGRPLTCVRGPFSSQSFISAASVSSSVVPVSQTPAKRLTSRSFRSASISSSNSIMSADSHRSRISSVFLGNDVGGNGEGNSGINGKQTDSVTHVHMHTDDGL